MAKHDPIFLFVHDIGVLFESVKMFPSIEVYFVHELYIWQTNIDIDFTEFCIVCC